MTDMSTIKTPGGITVRFIEAINGFKTKHGCWPDVIEAEPETLIALATHYLTPLGFFLLQSKVSVRPGQEGRIIARSFQNDLAFDYGREGFLTEGKHRHDARQWLGLDEDPQ